ncbi:hydroxyacylglutathione hydrolase tenzing norgay isoform X2 [Brevipalpus obovatus]
MSSGIMNVHILPALSDNYMYLIVNETTKETAVVDPVEPDNVIAACKAKDLNLTRVLTTHHHWDHAGGNKQLVSKVDNLTVCGYDDRIGACNKKVSHGDEFKIGSLLVKCLFTPCHTSGHICYYVTSPQGDGAVFTGDTLFAAGCGKFFEGTADQMHDALIKTLGSLPDSTKVYCGHEYTIGNLKFARHVEPNNEHVSKKIEWAEKMRSENSPTIPTTIGEEKMINPFMRVVEKDVQEFAKSTDPVEVMGRLRTEKNNFVAR